MISYIFALIVYCFDPMLGVIVAVLFPSIIALDSENYSYAFAAFLFTVAIGFVRRLQNVV